MQNRKSLYLIILIFDMFFSTVNAQGNRVVIDTRKAQKQEVSNNLAKLAFEITASTKTNDDKARAIFYWIAMNIPYDYELRFNKKLQRRVYTSERNVLKNVLKRKKALCGGYAFLFEALCKEVDINVRVIHGYSKKENRPISNQVDHTWNAVEIGGGWKLLDITYARGMSGGGAYTNVWYDCNPKDFIKTHYPEDIFWTLLESPPTKQSVFTTNFNSK